MTLTPRITVFAQLDARLSDLTSNQHTLSDADWDEMDYLRRTALPMLAIETLQAAIEDILDLGFLTGFGIDASRTAGQIEIDIWLADKTDEQRNDIAVKFARTARDLVAEGHDALTAYRNLLTLAVIGSGRAE